jgi:hypothetical protein
MQTFSYGKVGHSLAGPRQGDRLSLSVLSLESISPGYIMAPCPLSPVRTRIRSTGETKILPSPGSPVKLTEMVYNGVFPGCGRSNDNDLLLGQHSTPERTGPSGQLNTALAARDRGPQTDSAPRCRTRPGPPTRH